MEVGDRTYDRLFLPALPTHARRSLGHPDQHILHPDLSATDQSFARY